MPARKKEDKIIFKTGKTTKGPSILYKRAIKIPNPSVNDPYLAVQKTMFEDAFNSDPTVQQAIVRRAQFTLGKHVKLSLEATDETLDDKAKDALVNDKQYQGALDKIREIDESVNAGVPKSVDRNAAQAKDARTLVARSRSRGYLRRARRFLCDGSTGYKLAEYEICQSTGNSPPRG